MSVSPPLERLEFNRKGPYVTNKLTFRIAFTLALAVLLINAALGFFMVRNEREKLLRQDNRALEATLSALQGDMARSIQHQNFQNLSETLSEVAGQFDVEAYKLFDSKGKVLIEESLKPEASNLQLSAPRYPEPKMGHRLEPIHTPLGAAWRYIVPLFDSEGEEIGVFVMVIPAASVDQAMRSYVLKTVLGGLLIALLVTLILTPVFQKILVNPIHEMQRQMEALSKGEADLTFQINVKTKDELGEMGQWFNSFLGKIRAMVLRVLEHSLRLSEQVAALNRSTAEVSAMSGDVTNTIQQIAKGAEEQAVKIAEVNHLMQEVQETMKQVEIKAHETTSAVDKATQTAKVGGRLARGTIDKMVSLSELILKDSEMVDRMGIKSREVGRVVELISGIAEQTNLLSLNAAIEAARAGEQGRGFAVVADEIRALADGSSRAVQEITTLVQEMQDETKGVVESMGKSADEAQSSKEGIRQMEYSLDEIVTVIENVMGHTKSITEMLNAQTQRFNKIVHSIQDINAVSEQSAASTQEVSASTEEQTASMEQVTATFRELEAMADELKGMVEKFKIQ
jgi:methyl-accepting chemotaxis protein